MRWIKVLAIGAAVIVAFFVLSAVLHLIYLAVVAIVIGAVIVGAIKAYSYVRTGLERGRRARRPKAERGGTLPREVEAGPRVTAPRTTAPRAAAPGTTAAHRPDVEEELARLKRELQ